MANKYMKRHSVSLEIREMQTIEMQTKWDCEILFHPHTRMGAGSDLATSDGNKNVEWWNIYTLLAEVNFVTVSLRNCLALCNKFEDGHTLWPSHFQVSSPGTCSEEALSNVY